MTAFQIRPPEKAFRPHEIVAFSKTHLYDVIAHIVTGILPAERVLDEYYIHPEDARDYIYYTTGRLKRLMNAKKETLHDKETALNLCNSKC